MKVSFLAGAMFLACQMTLTTPLLSAMPQKTSTNNSNQTKRSGLNSTAAKQMTQLATRLLQHVDEARHAISSNQKQAAINRINQAVTERNQLASLAKSNGLSMVVPLYSEFDETSTLGPLMAARKGNQQSKPKASPNGYTPVTVEQASGEATFVGLDLDKAKTRLEAAKTALNNGNTQAAADSLNAVETDLVMETEQTNFPLLAARENLGIAESAIKNGHTKESAAALKEASTDLSTFASQNPARHADEARSLGKTIDTYSQSLNQNHSGAANKIDGWWREVDSWFEHPAQSS